MSGHRAVHLKQIQNDVDVNCNWGEKKLKQVKKKKKKTSCGKLVAVSRPTGFSELQGQNNPKPNYVSQGPNWCGEKTDKTRRREGKNVSL